MTDPYTAEARLCDDAGMISDELVAAGSPGTVFDYGLTYRRLLNNLRAHTGLPPYKGQPIGCTGSAHLALEHFRCTSPFHRLAPVPDIALCGDGAQRVAEIVVRRGTASW